MLLVGTQDVLAERLRILERIYPDIELVGEVAEGALALKAAVHLRPDVVMVGERLPDTDGLQVCDRLRRLFPSTALIFVSETITDSIRLLAVEAGASGLLSPLDPDDLLMMLILRAAEGEFLLSREVILRLFQKERELRLQALSMRGLSGLDRGREAG